MKLKMERRVRSAQERVSSVHFRLYWWCRIENCMEKLFCVMVLSTVLFVSNRYHVPNKICI